MEPDSVQTKMEQYMQTDTYMTGKDSEDAVPKTLPFCVRCGIPQAEFGTQPCAFHAGELDVSPMGKGRLGEKTKFLTC
jgi:hypothetical protein